jgi:hypothetical protein
MEDSNIITPEQMRNLEIIPQLVGKLNTLIELVKTQEKQIRLLTKTNNQVYVDVEKQFPGSTSETLKKILIELNETFKK